LIDQPVVSLSQLSGHTWELEQILEPIIQKFLDFFEVLQKQGFAPFQNAYNELLAFKGQSIRCQDGARQIEGVCHSVDAQGRLNLVLDDTQSPHLINPFPTMTALNSGEIKDN
jgi:biotin-(acetyl-CoA carboxylase) ligase